MKKQIVSRVLMSMILGAGMLSLGLIQGARAQDAADYNWPNDKDTSIQDWNWYKYSYDQIYDHPVRLFSSAAGDIPFSYQRNGLGESAKLNSESRLVTEATLLVDSTVLDSYGNTYPQEMFAYRSIASPIYGSPFADRCGMVYGLSADGGAHWRDVYPGQNIKFEFPGDDLRMRKYMWSNTNGAEIGGDCSPLISAEHVYYNTDIYHTDHTFNNANLAEYSYSTLHYTTVPSLPLIKDGDMIRTKGEADVYIVKYIGDRRYRRLILSPSVFDSYQHLKWENVIDIDKALLNSYENYSYVRVAGDSTIWLLEPDGDTGTRRQVYNLDTISDKEAAYEINTVDRDSYVRGADVN